MPKDACYHSVKARYDVFPSARASQAIAKCRKGKGQVTKSKKGSDLKRWQKEKWTDTKSGKACGAGGSNEYCRPKKKISSKTPKTVGEMSKSELKRKKAEKSRVGMGRRVTSLESLNEIFEFGVKDVIAKHPMKTIGAGLAAVGLAHGTYQMKKHDKRMKADPKYARRYKAMKARQMREGIAEDRKIANLKLTTHGKGTFFNPYRKGAIVDGDFIDESHVRKAKQRLRQK